MGTIVDAASSRPLPDAAVTLEPRPAGALTGDGANGAFLRSTRTVRTDREGRYRFAPLANGEYRLHVQRLGYRPASVDVDLRDAAGSHVSVGLVVEPVALEPVSVSAAPRSPDDLYGLLVPGEGSDSAAGAARLAAERLRQRLYLSSDARAVTHADVEQGITLAETDLFRALQRLPGVSSPDEYSAELWTRGAPWDQTRVYFDGLPLFHPVHALGLFSGVNSDAVGATFLHPGVQPIHLGGAAAGVLDIHSRRGGSSGVLRGLGELSLASARLALDGESADGRHAWMVAGRRSYLDLLTGIAEALLSRDKTYQLPYRFYDLTARYDAQLGEGSTLELSGIAQRNGLGNDNPNVLNGTAAHWSGGALRATLENTLGGVRLRHTVGGSGFASSVDRWEAEWDPQHSGVANQRQSNTVGYAVLEGEITPGGFGRWSIGYGAMQHAVRFVGPRPTPFTPLDPTAYLIQRDDRQVDGILWGERRWKLLRALAIETGLRVEAGERVRNGGAFRLAPRLAIRYQIDPALSVSAATGRSWQYVQALNPAGPSATPGFRTDQLWLLAGDSVPAIRTDVATLGVERWMGDGWLVGVTGYVRGSGGVTISDPAPGAILDRPLWVTAENQARGIELSARKLAGRWTSSASYSYGTSTMTAVGQRFPAPADQRHVLDATALLRVEPEWQLGAAYTAASGHPYTRTFAGAIGCELEAQCGWREEPWVGEPGGQRMGWYQSLDLLAEWNRTYRRGWKLGVYLQLRNVLNHDNPGRYLGYQGEYCLDECAPDGDGEARFGPRDEFVASLPIVPLVGLRLAF